MFTRHRHNKFMKSATFILGSLAGTGTALLFAPGSGKETRHRIGRYAGDVKDRAQCYTLRGRDKMTGSARKARDYFSERRSLVSASFDAGKKAYAAEKRRLAKVH
ncbi:MAG: YtxH domain-containing protein [Candidatus Sulfobium sp.]